MKKISKIGTLLKKIYRLYGRIVLDSLEQRGFTDLRPSFLEVLLHICENRGATIKEIGAASDLKKQTMTSHLNELKKRGYIYSLVNEHDKREQQVFLTDFGEKFKLILLEVVSETERKLVEDIGEVELDRIGYQLDNFYNKLKALK